ncbi:MAG TPA: nuclear transport factor 2 family protein [Actinomycetota bacterium]
MRDTSVMLERAGRRFDMPEPAMDRLVRRRERKLRTQRIATIVASLVIAAVGIGSALLALREQGATQPAGGVSAPTTPGDGVAGVVLPTLAIGAGIVLLGVSALVIVRLRGRSALAAHGAIGAGTAPAHGPAAEPRTAPSEGGTEMDSKARQEIRIPSMQLPEVRPEKAGRPRLFRWLPFAGLVVAVGLVVMGVSLFAPSEPARLPTPVPLNAEAAIDELLATISSHDMQAAADLYAEDATMVTTDGSIPEVVQGRDTIRGALTSMNVSGDWTLERASDVIGRGRLAGYLELYHGTNWESTYGVTAFLFDEEGRIAGQATLYTSGPESAGTWIKPKAISKRVATIDELLATISTGNMDAAAELYAEDAIMVTTDGTTPDVYEGRNAIRGALTSMNQFGDLTLERASDVTIRGRLAGYLELYHGSGGWEGMYGVTAFLFDEQGRIAGQVTLYT